MAPFDGFGNWGPACRSSTSRPSLLTCPVPVLHGTDVSHGPAVAARSSHGYASRSLDFPTDSLHHHCLISECCRLFSLDLLWFDALTCIPAETSGVVLAACRAVILSWSPPVASSRSVPDQLLSTESSLLYVLLEWATIIRLPEFFSHMT